MGQFHFIGKICLKNYWNFFSDFDDRNLTFLQIGKTGFDDINRLMVFFVRGHHFIKSLI